MTMLRSLTILVSGASVAAVYLLLSGAPARVHIVELGILLPTVWVGAAIMASRRSLRLRTPVVLAVIAGAAAARAYLLPMVVAKSASGVSLFFASFLLLGGLVVVTWLMAVGLDLLFRAGITR